MQELFKNVGGSSQLNTLLDAPRCCLRCRATYTERNNLGEWKCTAYHPLAEYTTFSKLPYRCCGKPYGSFGCVKADHTDELCDDIQPRVINAALLALLDKKSLLAREHSCKKTSSGNVIIKRVDERTYHRRCNVSESRASTHHFVTRMSGTSRFF